MWGQENLPFFALKMCPKNMFPSASLKITCCHFYNPLALSLREQENAPFLQPPFTLPPFCALATSQL